MAKNTVGRPTRYNQTIIDRICALVLDGQPIRFICSQVDMPSLATVMRWLCDYPDFAQQYSQAKEMYAQCIFDEILHIADTCEPMDVQKAKLMIDARKYVAGKLAPKKYGDIKQIELEQTTKILEAPIFNIIGVSPDK